MTHPPSVQALIVRVAGPRRSRCDPRSSPSAQCACGSQPRPEPREATATSRDLRTDTVRARACQGWSRGRGRHATYLGRSRGSRVRAHAPPNARGIATAPHVLGAGRRAASVSSLPMRPHMAHTYSSQHQPIAPRDAMISAGLEPAIPGSVGRCAHPLGHETK